MPMPSTSVISIAKTSARILLSPATAITMLEKRRPMPVSAMTPTMIPAQAQIAISCTTSREDSTSASNAARGPMRSAREESQLATIAETMPMAPARNTE